MSDSKQQRVILLYRVSGTDPTKEASVRVWFAPNADIAKTQTSKILTDLFQSQIDDILEAAASIKAQSSNENDKKQKVRTGEAGEEAHQVQLHKVQAQEAQEDQDTKELVSYLRCELAYLLEHVKRTGELTEVRPWSPRQEASFITRDGSRYYGPHGVYHATLVCIDYNSSYDYHYYLETRLLESDGTGFILDEH